VEPIKPIGIPNVAIPQVVQSDWILGIPFVPNNDPPITLQIGFPIVDMPGCVTMHKDNKDHVSGRPFDRDLVNQDEKGTTTLCPHGEYPTYEAMDYQPENLVVTRETPPPPIAPPPEVEPPTPPDTSNVGGKEEVPCPAPNQPRVGDLTQNGEERVIGHEIQNGQCVVLYESTTAVEKFLPSTNQVSTTAAIAVVATASAAATPLLLRVIKPIIKKLTTTIQKKLGKGKKKKEQTSNQILKKYGMKKLVLKKNEKEEKEM
tara:strand:- start:489 stop:1268 length:780 start_codon:yes stop_codon:yes gene_type:complete